MKYPKLSDKTKSILKFEAKLLLAVLVLALIEFYLVSTFIQTAGKYVANAYTGQFFQ